jgi:hypothetical protein
MVGSEEKAVAGGFAGAAIHQRRGALGYAFFHVALDALAVIGGDQRRFST